MAYKFQLGDSVLSGAVEQEGNIVASDGFISASSHLQTAGNATVAGHVLPNADDASDLGSSSKEFKDLYLDGVAYIDSLQADQLGAALDANDQAITNINVDSGAIDGTVIGANSQAAAEFTTLSASSTLSVAGAADFNGTSDFEGAMNLQAGITVAGAADLNGALDVAGAVDLAASGVETDIRGTLSVDEAAVFDSSLQVAGAADLNGALDVAGAVDLAASGVETDIRGTLSVDEAAVFDSSLQVAGAADLNGALDVAGEVDLAASGVETDIRGTLSVDEAAVFDSSIQVDGAADFNSTSDFQGAMNLQAGITVAGAADLNGALDVAGAASLAASGVATSVRGTLSVAEEATFTSNITGSGDLFIEGFATLAEAQVESLDEGAIVFAAAEGELVSSEEFGYNDDGLGGDKFLQVRTKGPDSNNYASIMAKTGSIVVLNAAEDGLLAYLGHDGVVSGSSFESAGDAVVAGDMLPNADDSSDLGSSSKQWKDLYIDGVAYIDSLQADQLGAALDANSQAITNINVDSGAIDGTVIGANSQAAAEFTTISGSGAASFASTMYAPSLGSATVSLTADLMVIDDGASGDIKTTSLADYAGALAGGPNEGLKSVAGRLALDLEDLSTDTALTAGGGDSLAFIDSGDSNASKNITVTNFLTSIAGAGISVSNGQLISDASPTPQDIGDADGTLAEGMNFSVTDFTVARTWTLPASPDAGDVVSVKAPGNASSYNLSIAVPGSETIDGESSLLIESDHGAIDLVYVGSDKWVIR